jgi:hypothetical protein
MFTNVDCTFRISLTGRIDGRNAEQALQEGGGFIQERLSRVQNGLFVLCAERVLHRIDSLLACTKNNSS